MQVHARFTLFEDARASAYSHGGYVDAARVKLAAVQGELFDTAPPQGNIEMLITNPEAARMFHDAALGQEFDVYFSPVEAEKAST